MNPTLLKDLILAGHRVACKDDCWDWIVFLFIRWDWQIQWTDSSMNIEWCIESWLSSMRWNDDDIKNSFTWEYKIVTPIPQPPQVWDTVEAIRYSRVPIWTKLKVLWYTNDTMIQVSGMDNWESYYFPIRDVAKCEPEKEQSIQSEEQFWDTIVFNWRTYKAI